jgi:MoaA/NifB/PqqE/SkfB family radical SAM enzyme
MEQYGVYSQLKPLWHLDRIAALRQGRIPAPVHVQLHLSDLCNQDCVACNYRASAGLSEESLADNPDRKIPTDKALEILEDCAELGVKAIQFTGGGEPTVHPQHLAIFQRAQVLGMDTGLVTNGVLLDPTSPAVLALTWIRVSIDAGDEAMYTKYRRAPCRHFHQAWDHIKELRKQNYAGVLGVGYVVGPANYQGILEAAERARGAGADNMRVSGVTSKLGITYYASSYTGGTDVVSRIKDAIFDAKYHLDSEDFKVIDLFTRRLKEYEEQPPKSPQCYYQHFCVLIGGDLSVNRCCNTTYTQIGVVGSLKTERFRDFMRDAAFAYHPFDARKCQFCQFQAQNRAIEAALTPPPHENFV